MIVRISFQLKKVNAMNAFGLPDRISAISRDNAFPTVSKYLSISDNKSNLKVSSHLSIQMQMRSSLEQLNWAPAISQTARKLTMYSVKHT